jgi:hypothetical protein
MMNRTEVDTYVAQMQIEATRLQAKLPVSPISWLIKNQAKRTLEQADEMLNDKRLETLKIGLDNFQDLSPDQKSQVTQAYTWWTAAAQETLKTLQMLSAAIG